METTLAWLSALGWVLWFCAIVVGILVAAFFGALSVFLTTLSN